MKVTIKTLKQEELSVEVESSGTVSFQYIITCNSFFDIFFLFLQDFGYKTKSF